MRILDARYFARSSYYFSSDQPERNLENSFKRALDLFPNIESIILDSHSEIDPLFLADSIPSGQVHDNLRLLSIAGCPSQLPTRFFASPRFHHLVYLDISMLPGSVLPLTQPGVLPFLRVLKLRSREIDDATLTTLVSHFGLRLWSLDIGGNLVTDRTLPAIRDWCLPVVNLRSSHHSQVEGKLISSRQGNSEYGLFVSIAESEYSRAFSHPEKYYADTPIYTSDSNVWEPEYRSFRADGASLPWSDRVDTVAKHLAETESHGAANSYHGPQGLTHLNISRNAISSLGLQMLLRTSNGQLEALACDFLPLLPRNGKHTKFWPPSTRLGGILGAAHFFRPVYCSNLQTLRIHHSFVTNIPTLEADELSSLAKIALAETCLYDRAQQAFPETFIPDVNPRLYSLTLTCLPRRSGGTLTSRLIAFLKLLAKQERDIQDASVTASTRHSPSLLKGLRHLRLEFEPDPLVDGFSKTEDLDAEELMASGGETFSFFEGEQIGRRISTTRSRSDASERLHAKGVYPASDEQLHGTDRDIGAFLRYDGEWNGEVFSQQAWIGAPGLSTSDVLQDYRQLVLNGGIRDYFGPSSPTQVKAGAPEESHVFHAAWNAAVMPRLLEPPPRDKLAAMGDVLDELRKYRLEGRASYLRHRETSRCQGRRITLGDPHYFWTGRLEVSTEDALPHSRPAQYWR